MRARTMTALASALGRLGRHQACNLWNACRGLPLTTPSLGSMTLEPDDVALARRWLEQDRGIWRDDAPARAFEAAFARFNGSAQAFAFASGREALSACLEILGLEPGDEVLLPGYTCLAVPNAIRFAGLEAVHADIELETFGLEAAAVQARLTPRTKVILLQHLYGLVSRDYEAVLELARRRHITVIEDCAHATGAELRGIKVGNRGDLAIYSCEQSKVFNAIRGGVATTNDPDLGARLHALQASWPEPASVELEQCLHCVSLYYHRFKDPRQWWLADLFELVKGRHDLAPLDDDELQGLRPKGYGAKMAAPIAALAHNQLGKLARFNRLRRAAAARWDTWCEATGHARPLVLEGSQPVFLRYPIMVTPKRKRDLRWAKDELGVLPGQWFLGKHHPLDPQIEDCPHANAAVAGCINLPTIWR